jgi:hypothetical protein
MTPSSKGQIPSTVFDGFPIQLYNVFAMADYESCAVSPLACDRRAVIACATVVGEMRPLLPSDRDHVLDFGLHVNPQDLKRILQETVDALAPEVDTILLGYGLCSGEVEAYVKKLIDDVARDGGYILANGAVLDDTNPENLHAMIDTGKTYGVY